MKEKRDRLFKRGRPHIRPLMLIDECKPHSDVGLTWVAYRKNSFPFFPEGMNEETFFNYISTLSESSSLYVIEDKNKEYKDSGPVCIVEVRSNGWKIEPHAVYFPWATVKNKLRSSVAFFQMVRYQKIGCCVVYSLIESKPLFDKMQEYGVLNYVGRIPNGDARGDEYMYTIRGKKK